MLSKLLSLIEVYGGMNKELAEFDNDLQRESKDLEVKKRAYEEQAAVCDRLKGKYNKKEKDAKVILASIQMLMSNLPSSVITELLQKLLASGDFVTIQQLNIGTTNQPQVGSTTNNKFEKDVTFEGGSMMNGNDIMIKGDQDND